MKQLLSLFLFLLPCLALAQYPSNGNQKITLGEQSTADGLIWRGVAADTTLTAKSDTAAYFVLDTVNINLYTYKASATGRKWRQLGADTASIAYVNTYDTQTVNGAKTFSSTITGARFDPTSSNASGKGMYAPTSTSLGFSVDNTNRMTLDNKGMIGVSVTPNPNINVNFRGFEFPQGATYTSRNDIPRIFFTSNFITESSGIKRQVDGRGIRLVLNGVPTFTYDFYIEAMSNGLAGATGVSVRKITLDTFGNFGIGNDILPTEKLDVDGNARIRGLANASNPVNVQVDVNGVLIRTSSIELKEHIESLPYGLNEILLLQPSKFKYKDKYKYGEGYDIGFIAEDVNNVIPEAVGTGVESDIFMDSVKIIPVLVKAIQEQQALIKALEQRIINLENK